MTKKSMYPNMEEKLKIALINDRFKIVNLNINKKIRI